MASKKSRKVGRLLVIGGAEDPEENKLSILPHFVKMCGGRRARIVVCGSPSKRILQTERRYKQVFERLGAKDVYDAQLTNRHEADDPEPAEMVQRASGVFFTGGDQLRLTSLIAGTKFGEAVRDRLWKEGLIVGGTSAGAAAMSSTMIIGGNSRGTVRREDVRLAPGLGYWRDTTIDTHFAQRGRLSRMLAIFAQNPQVLGIGLDEDTAIDVTPGKEFRVLGSGACFVFDGTVTFSNAPDIADDEVLSMTDAVMHVLPDGFGFDLQTKRPILPSGKRIPRKTPS